MPSIADDAFRVEHLGREREPLVVIDDFIGQVEELARIARLRPYEPVQGYPGIRSRVSSTYFAARSGLLRRILAEHFELPAGAKVESCDFSIVSKRPEDLTSGQRRPHYDAADAVLLALLHFTGDATTGGTAFYRHRRTGFETIRPERLARFQAALIEDEREFGPYPARYFHGDDERYEMIGEIEARPDRAIIYRGRLLHSGHVPVAPDPATALETGRLTINTFLVGQR
ncbi:MAG TPA: DUF6445 family protein [Croceibacterium sp.]